jgi:hypothetical protein
MIEALIHISSLHLHVCIATPSIYDSIMLGAISNGHREIVLDMVSRGASDYESAIVYAASATGIDMILMVEELMDKRGMWPGACYMDVASCAARAGNIEALKYIATYHDGAVNDYITSLMACKGNLVMVKLMMEEYYVTDYARIVKEVLCSHTYAGKLNMYESLMEVLEYIIGRAISELMDVKVKALVNELTVVAMDMIRSDSDDTITKYVVDGLASGNICALLSDYTSRREEDSEEESSDVTPWW